MSLAWLVGAVVVAAACFVQGLAGFGIGLVSLAFLPFLMSPQQAVVLITLYAAVFIAIILIPLRRDLTLHGMAELVAGTIRFEKALPPWHKEIVYDPQTSGGLLIAVPESQGETLLRTLHSSGIRRASIVGQVKPLTDGAHLVFK